MTGPETRPVPAPDLITTLTAHDRSAVLCLLAICERADADGSAALPDVAVAYRTDYLRTLVAEGRAVEAEAGRLSLDEVRDHVTRVALPRLVALGAIETVEGAVGDATRVRLAPSLLLLHSTDPEGLQARLRLAGEQPPPPRRTPAVAAVSIRDGAVLSAHGLVKTYRNRNVVNQVALELRQGEIVGLLGPNGAGKTTTFYMIAGLIPPASGSIRLDGEDITRTPMYMRARRGIGYLSQEPSIFRKLTVEENILAILETLPITRAARSERLEALLRELNIEHLRQNKAFSLSGGERRRLEITRALVTEPRFMMLDEPFAGVDPLAVHDIQVIVASLKDRGIGVLISDHNVEQTLDIVDRAYIMFDGAVKVSGSVRELIFDETVSRDYFGPTLTSRLRERFRSEHPDPAPVGAVTVGVPA